MGQLTTADKRAWLRRQYLKVTASVTLLSVLNSLLASSVDAVSGGSISAVTGNGQSTQFSNSDRFTPAETVSLAGEMLDLYDRAKARLAADSGIVATDAQVYEMMLALLAPVREVYSDFSQLRTGVSV